MAVTKSFRPTDADAALYAQLFDDQNMTTSEQFHAMVAAVAAQRDGAKNEAVNAENAERLQRAEAVVNNIAAMYETTPDELEKTCEAYKQQFFQKAAEADRFGVENSTLKQRLQDAEMRLQECKQEAETRLQENETRLQERLQNVITIDLQPFTRKLMDLTVARLSERYKREVTPEQILVDMFLRYTVSQNTEWFYPFVIKDREIVDAAREMNPQINSIRQIEKMLTK